VAVCVALPVSSHSSHTCPASHSDARLSPPPTLCNAACTADVLVNCFRSVLAAGVPGEIVQAAYLACGKIAPDYMGMELNVGAEPINWFLRAFFELALACSCCRLRGVAAQGCYVVHAIRQACKFMPCT
jgi:hypothetical protein